MSYDRELKFAQEVAREAGVIMKRYFRADDINLQHKGDNTPVTEGDLAVNRMVIERVQADFPGYDVLGEEESYEAGGDYVWVVDPIDGTVPFSIGMPTSTFLLALVDKDNGQPVVAVIYDPYLDQLYHATKGGGAYLNGMPAHTSKDATFLKSYMTLHGPILITDQVNYHPGRVWDKLRSDGAGLLNMSSGAYTGAKIATGEVAAIAMANGKPWDSATLCLLIEEAGGVTSDLVGQPRRYDEHGLGFVAAANQPLHTKLLELIKAT